MTDIAPEPQSQDRNQRIIDAVHERFQVATEYLREDSAIEFNLNQDQNDLKTKFLSLIGELRTYGDTAVLRKSEKGYLLIVVRKPRHSGKRSNTPLILMIATLVVILVDGFIRAYSYPTSLSHLTTLEEVTAAGIYTVSLFGIIAIHEMGHKVASWYHKMDSSWPYFIPGIPGIWPTMGAVISARDPPVNRDSLFDLGISGPVAGLTVTVIVSIVAVFSAQLIPVGSVPASQLTSTDYYTNFLISMFRTNSSNDVIVGATFSLLYFAYSFGFLLTFINLLPAWQLDGGHISNAATSPRVHKLLTYISVLIMILIQFYLMAFLILLLSGRSPRLEPLDTVSPLSSKRKLFFILTWVLALSIFVLVLYNNALFGIGLLFK
ncbi:MAG: site-2 protease family protein [Nitrososphaerota archaeon]|nr:site-2 protease family protein [Nitrososphaerota archaeon]